MTHRSYTPNYDANILKNMTIIHECKTQNPTNEEVKLQNVGFFLWSLDCLMHYSQHIIINIPKTVTKTEHFTPLITLIYWLEYRLISFDLNNNKDRTEITLSIRERCRLPTHILSSSKKKSGS